MANVPKAITDLPIASAMGDDDLLVVSQNATTSSIKGELIKGYAQNAVASQVTAAQTAANQAGQSATQAEAARQGAAAAQTAAESAQDAAETARDQSVAAAGTIGDSVEQAQDAASQASSAKDAAVAAQTAAEAAKTAAETASGQAQTAATQAAGSATAAQTAATQAGDAKTDAETARNEAETSASSAANSASDAESAATEAEQAKTYIENMNMEGETLPAGSSVTVTKTTSPEGNLLFVIGVPQGIQGDKGETGETGATGPQGVSITNATVNEDGDLVITLSSGSPINAGSVIGPQGIQGEVGPTGASVDHIERTSGTGAPGTTDTYTVYLTDGQTGGTFQVYNGSNGTGSGDFMADGSVPMTGDLQMGGHKITNLAEPTDNTDAASKEYVDDTITVSLVGNYIPTGQKGQANGVASLDGSGKVPNEQLPPMDYVPTSRTVNGHALSADVTLDADDVGAIPNPTGGTAGQVLTKTADGSAWEDAPSGLPDGGVEGQMLYKSADGAAWGDKPVMYVTVTKSSDGSGHKVDKDAGEIKAAYEAGSSVFLVWDRNDLGKDDWQVIPLSAMDISANGNHYASFLNLNYSAVVDVDGDVDITEVVFTSSEITYNNSNSGLTSTNAQDAINEVQENVENVLPTGGTPGQVLTKTSTGEEWSDAPSGLPEGGTEGQVIKKTADGAEWDNADWLPLNGGTMSGDIAMGGHKITNLGAPTNANDAVRQADLKVVSDEVDGIISGTTGITLAPATTTKIGGVIVGDGIEVEADGTISVTPGLTQEQADERYLQLTGGTVTGEVDMGQNPIRNVSAIFGGTGFTIRSSGTTAMNAYMLNISTSDGTYISGGLTSSNIDATNITVSNVGSGDTAVPNKAYVDSKSPTSVTVTLTADGWVDATAVPPPGSGGTTVTQIKQQTVTVSGVVASETAQLITPTPAIASQSAYYEAGIMCTGQAANSLTFTCQTVPTSNLTVYVVIQPLG
jgi:hypothetical protein